MSLRAFVLSLPLVAVAPVALAQEADLESHRELLAEQLNGALNGDGSLADRFAKSARTWAFHKDTNKSDRARLKRAVTALRALMQAPQAAMEGDAFNAFGDDLTSVMGPQASRMLSLVQQSVAQELGGLLAKARATRSDPVNNRPVNYNGKTYTWRDFGGTPILAEQGAALSKGAVGGTSFSTVRDGPGGKELDTALHGEVDQRNLDGLKPEFREKVIRVLRRLMAKGYKARVAEGLRTREQQAEKVRKGYSKTMNSKHLKGLAADIIGQHGWSGPAESHSFGFWKDLGLACEMEDLTWGGNWKSFPDVAHVEDAGKGWNGPKSANTGAGSAASSAGSSSPSSTASSRSLPSSFSGGSVPASATRSTSGGPQLSTAAAGNVAGGQGTVDLIKRFEGFRSTPYWDVNAYRAGYGSDTYTTADGRVHRVTQSSRVSRADAERDLARRAVAFQNTVRRQVGAQRFDGLPANAQAALTSVAYNYGSLPSNVVRTIRGGGGVDQIAASVEALQGHNGGINRNRRLQEAAIIRRG